MTDNDDIEGIFVLNNQKDQTNSAGNKRKCLKCHKVDESFDIMCAKCKSKIPIDNKVNIDSPYILNLICLTGLFFILFVGDDTGLLPQSRQEALIGVSYLLGIISLSLALSLLLLSRDQLTMRHVYEGAILLISPVLLIFSISLAFVFEFSFAFVMISFLLMTLSGSLIFIFRDDFGYVSKPHLAILISGTIVIAVGNVLSTGDIENITGLWFLSGKVLILVGLSFIFISANLIAKQFSLMQIVSTPNILIFISTIFIITAIFFDGGSLSEPSNMTRSFILMGISLLFISSSVWIRKRILDQKISGNEKKINMYKERSEKLMKENKNFYALQQLDRAISLNPVHGFGGPMDQDNILIETESADRLKRLTFFPEEYELALNEKGMMLASQGRFMDAVKEIEEAVRRRPKYLESYLNLSMLYSSIPGKNKESSRNMDYYFSYKDHYISNWLEYDIPYPYIDWISKNYENYRKTLKRRSEILEDMGLKGDIWSYYSIMKD